MKKLKKGDIVARLSYGKDIIFVIQRIIKTKDGEQIAILNGLTVRVQADSPLEDLEEVSPKIVEEHIRKVEEKALKRIKKQEEMKNLSKPFRETLVSYTGRILHIDGDRKYSEKSRRYYKKLGLTAFVKNIPERNQPYYIKGLIQRYEPDILIITRTWRND